MNKVEVTVEARHEADPASYMRLVIDVAPIAAPLVRWLRPELSTEKVEALLRQFYGGTGGTFGPGCRFKITELKPPTGEQYVPKIAVIKLVRQITGLGLYDAKIAIDRVPTEFRALDRAQGVEFGETAERFWVRVAQELRDLGVVFEVV